MPDNSSDNRRIAKNTLLLYIRMIYSLIISLYTSRVILAALGFQDYGLYNVIGSVVSMFVFLRTSMGNSVQRFITFAIGQNDRERLSKTFSLSMMIHIGLALLIIILCETLGLWFLNSQMSIPEGREFATNWVFQFSIITCALSVICTPYDAEIIAHEKMGIFALIQILNSTLNLIIALAVKYASVDKLILYAFLLMMVQVMNRTIYGFYCGKNFPETKLHFVKDKALFFEMFGFAGWSLIGNLAYVGYTQGINIMLNVFFGSVINAARGIAYQIQGTIKGFVTNFQMAVNPQITKTFAQNDFKRLHMLIGTSSKLSFYLLLCLTLPIAIEAKQILRLWLGEVPDYTISFTILTLAILLIEPLSNPLGIANNATGDIKKYQLIEGGGLLTILPIGYIFIRITNNPISVFIVQLVVMSIVQFLRIFLVCHKIKMSKREYVKNILSRVVIVLLASMPVPLFVSRLLEENYLSMIVVVAISIVSVLLFAYVIGTTSIERDMIEKYMLRIFKIKNQ